MAEIILKEYLGDWKLRLSHSEDNTILIRIEGPQEGLKAIFWAKATELVEAIKQLEATKEIGD